MEILDFHHFYPRLSRSSGENSSAILERLCVPCVAGDIFKEERGGQAAHGDFAEIFTEINTYRAVEGLITRPCARARVNTKRHRAPGRLVNT